MLFDQGWLRFLLASLLLAGYGAAEMVSGLASWRRRWKLRRPIWSHLFGFFSLILFYGGIGSDGRSWWDDLGNGLGTLICVVALALRIMASGGSERIRHPDLMARALFFAAMPLAMGSPRSFLVLTLPQLVIAAWEGKQRDESPEKRAGPRESGAP